MKTNKIFIKIVQLLIVFIFLFIWEILSKYNVINTFIFSSPSKILKCIINLYKNNNLVNHILITLKETIIAFSLSILISFIIAIIFYEIPILFNIFEPFLTIINSTPKVAIGPLIIIIFGASQNSIIIMALSITLILNILSIYNGFTNVNKYLLKLLNSLNASRFQKLKYLIVPSAYSVIINSLKINISMTLIGVIMGEFLVSKAGIGYLIIYGTQVFDLTLVLSGIIILMIISYILYLFINIFERKTKKHS
ncbi:MAG: ABC transporter permease subunit [Bacilli bacterium]|nr:ABC transporter permease subunit [Bacilli bacterium]